MAKKIQLQDASGNVLHPLTLGECVAMDNGENLDTLMSKSQMFTPTIAQDKSMFKVGTGVDVDYSANVKDGAYESLVFKGKSLVNLVENPTSANVGGNKKWNGYGGGNPSKTFITNGIRLANTQYGSIVLDYFDLSLFKPNTKYTLFIDVYHNGEGTAPVLDKIAGTGHYAIPLANGHNCIVFTTISDLTSANMGIRFGYAGSTSESCVYEFSNIVIVEGDHSSINPDYFTGLCDSKMPILRNVGKNLLDINTLPIKVGSNICQIVDGEVYSRPTVVYEPVRWILPVEPNTTYTVSAVGSADAVLQFSNFYNTSDPSLDARISYKGNERKAVTFTTTTHTSLTISLFSALVKDLSVGSIQLEKGDAATTYEDYKTNILRTSEEIVLREVNGVQDTYNPLTGEYVRRIGEIVLDGSESWNLWRTETPYSLFEWHNSLSIKNGNVAPVILTDKLPVFTGDVLWNSSEKRGIGSNENRLRIRIECETVEELKLWLQSNPITVQYELAEPVTAIVKPSTMTPFAYQNGHVVVESGFEGQSLLPEIEYSVVTGRTGQVTQNTKVLRQQEQQIIGLEELLLTQVVQMEYERTLLQFDYELQMMMLG